MGALVALALLAPTAVANKFEVTRHNDPKPGKCKPKDCSLREAILRANKHAGKDAVVLPNGRRAYRLSRPNAPAGISEQAGRRGDLDVKGRLILRHPGRGLATIDAQGVDRVLEVLPGGNATIRSIKLTGGDAAFQPLAPRMPRRRGGGSNGGAIFSDTGRVTLIGSRVADNAADGAGGIWSFGGKLRLVRTKVVNNKGLAGVMAGDARVSRSTVRGNEQLGLYILERGAVKRTRVARNGRSGIVFEGADATVRGSTLSRNGGSGISITFPSDVSIVNSTVSRNRTTTFGGGIDISGSTGTAEVRINSVTVVGNVADTDGDMFGNGGGIRASMADVSVVNSIVSRNRVAGAANDCWGTFDSPGGNLLSTIDDCTGFNPGGGDFLAANPKLGKLKRNGGPTKTHALRKGSPAIGKAVKAAAPKRDQRGVKRGRKPDIGAYER